MTVDPRALAELLEESQDLQADALRPTHAALDELVDLSHSSEDGDVAANQAFHEENQRGLRASFAGASLLGAAGGAALVGVLASAAGAQSSQDVQVLQTAASIENLAVATYKTALTLPYIGGATANGVVTKFATVTMGQHLQHADAFNSAIKSLGGKAQTNPDPAFVPVVNKAVKGLTGVSAAAGTLGVVGLALELENIAAETCSQLLAKATVGALRTSPTEIVFHLADDLAHLTEVVALARREKACCSFFRFTVEIDVESVELKVSVPAEAAGVLDDFQALITP